MIQLSGPPAEGSKLLHTRWLPSRPRSPGTQADRKEAHSPPLSHVPSQRFCPADPKSYPENPAARGSGSCSWQHPALCSGRAGDKSSPQRWPMPWGLLSEGHRGAQQHGAGNVSQTAHWRVRALPGISSLQTSWSDRRRGGGTGRTTSRERGRPVNRTGPTRRSAQGLDR